MITCHAWHLPCFRGKSNFVCPPQRRDSGASWVRTFVDVAHADGTGTSVPLEAALPWSGSCGSAKRTDAQIQVEPRSPSEGLESRGAAAWSGDAWRGQVWAPHAKRPRALGSSQIYYQ